MTLVNNNEVKEVGRIFSEIWSALRPTHKSLEDCEVNTSAHWHTPCSAYIKGVYSTEAMTDLGKELYGKDRAHQARLKNARARDEYLKRDLFPNSPWCRMVVPKKMAQHGLQIFRPEAVANAALGLIERGERGKAKG